MNMPMFIEIFLMLCIVAQPHICIDRQPGPDEEKIPAENTSVDHTGSIFSLINYAGNCTAYESLISEENYCYLEDYCERPPGRPRENGFVSYEKILCMVLYDAAQRVCETGRQKVTHDIKNLSNFSCDAIIKGVPESLYNSTKEWVKLFKAKLGNIYDCERACIQHGKISPVCEYIWKANALTDQEPVSSAFSADIPHAENPQVNSTGHGKTKKTSKDKPLDSGAFDLSPAAGPIFKLSNGSQNTEQDIHKKIPANKSPLQKGGGLVEANGNSTQSPSANDVKNNVTENANAKDNNVQKNFKKKAPATGNTGHNDAKKLLNTADSNTQNDTNKQAHATNSSNRSAEVTLHNGQVSHPVNTEHTQETDTVIQNTDNEDIIVTTDDTADRGQGTDEAGSFEGGVVDQEEDGLNQEEQSEKIHQHMETQPEKAESGSTAQFNQLGDVADSHFYAYFMTMVVICIIGYLVFHNKQKILALALEGRSRRGTRRRPNTSAYRKLDSNLEEAVTSTGSTSVTHVIY